MTPQFRRYLLVPAAAAFSAAWLTACAGGQPPQVRPESVATYDQKLGWILQYEDQRVLRDADAGTKAPSPAQAPPTPARGKATGSGSAGQVVFATTPPAPYDLARLLADPDARVRRRAALAVGRVGLANGVDPLVKALGSDAEPEVRQMAAFALGLLRAQSAVAPLQAALRDSSPVVQGRAAEALSVIGDAASAPAIGEMVAAHAKSGAVAKIAPDDLEEKHEPEVEGFRLGVLALGRLKAYEPLASAVLGPSGQPLIAWWPVAAAFQRTEDRRALGALVAFARGESRFGRAFAAKGLGALKDPAAIDPLATLAKNWVQDTRSAISAVKALAAIGDRRAGATLLALLHTKGLDPLLLVDVIDALGATRTEGAQEVLLDLVMNRSPAIRAAAFRSLRALDPDGFLLVLSGLDADRDWTVRAQLATLMGLYEQDRALPRLTAMLKDEDVRVLPSVIASLVKLKAPGLDKTLLPLLSHADFVVRAAAARGIGEIKPAGGDQALVQAFHAAARDESYGARAAILEALVKYGPEVAAPVLREGLQDKDWAVRVHAADLIAPLERATDPHAAIRPAPTGRDAAFYQRYEVVIPDYSPQAYIETERGTIQVELAVLDAPLTCLNFTTLVRNGFFKGAEWHRVVSNFVIQDGDPRGDGEGGPGYTIRDEISERPYLRGTVGMALDWADTGGSQFFITHSPQPHLDGRYTVFGQVTSGLDVLDRIQPHDKILRVRVWDGTTMVGQ